MGKFVYLTGQKFGHLTVLKRSCQRRYYPNGTSNLLWECECDCGYSEIILKTTQDLTKVKNPGCPNCVSKLVDLTGKQFGHITVLRRAEDRIHPYGGTARRWWCICDCNPQKEFVAYGKCLVEGQTQCPKCAAISRGLASKTYNVYDLSEEYGIGYTDNGQKFLFDKEDYELIKNYKWWVNNSGYLTATIFTESGKHGKNISFHRLVMNVLDNPDVVVDHIKHNLLDNRKTELRICTQEQNAKNTRISSINTSGVTGVYFMKKDKRWNAYIGYKGQRINLGYYINFEDAVKARKDAEEKYFGEYSYDNSMKL